MRKEFIDVDDAKLAYYRFNTIVVGSGAAGLNAASRIYDLGCKDVALVTEGMKMGTSRNTGSDKQTYYRLSESGGKPDNVSDMAKSIYASGATDKDLAFCEAAGSLRAFYRLTELGVGFPQDPYGVFTGYKTDHDPKTRATSAGPSTSRFMTEALEQQVRERDVRIFDGFSVSGILKKNEEEIIGLLTVEKATGEFVLFGCVNIIYATGGPAGLYQRSVYPGSQTGATGAALEAGVVAKNLTEWQYGIASVEFRWNLSGSYQQVIPRYVSTDADGQDPQEFLTEWFSSAGRMYDAIFLKGYQWPFDPRKVGNQGSSLIDVLVYNETEVKGRRVFLDFTQNPGRGALDFDCLAFETRNYLGKLGALFGTPIERLKHINEPAIALYQSHGIDISKQWLEIQVAAQHCNGGLGGDIWWQSNIKGFFPVGEANGSHGVYRPGGSALNAGQVGSFRAAQYAAARRKQSPPTAKEFERVVKKEVSYFLGLAKELANNVSGTTPKTLRLQIGESMSKAGGFIRHPDAIATALKDAKACLVSFAQRVYAEPMQLAAALRCRDLLITQVSMLTALLDYHEKGGRSRGSYLVYDKDGQLPVLGLAEAFRFMLDDGKRDDMIQQAFWRNGQCFIEWRPVRPMPKTEEAFENVWKTFLKDDIY
jgi:succinate dehydrogenase/fumarate reductase flavoprotein subunit